jgi:hypothetical protein
VKLLCQFFRNKAYGFNCFYWDEFDELTDWTFPIGLSGYFYGLIEFSVMINYIDFHSPNTLELSLNQYNTFFFKRIGLCPDSIICPCVHSNIVQNDILNPTLGTFTVDELLNKWNEGLKIDLQHFYYRKGSEIQLMEYSFTNR